MIAAGEKLLEICPDDLEAARRNQKAAELKGSPELVKRWTNYAIQVAQRIVESPAPKDSHALEIWNEAAAASAQLAAQGEYQLYRQAAAETSPREQIRLLDELRRRNPDSTYLSHAWSLYLHAYRTLGYHQQALEYAEKILAKDDQNEDAHLAAAEAHFESKSPKAIREAGKVITLMHTKPRPAEVRQEDWTRKRALYTGSASWIAGAMYISSRQFSEAEKMLQQALSALTQSDNRVAPVLFYLGWANYNLGNRDEAIRFYKLCSAIKSEFQEQASKNLQAVSSERRAPGA